MNRRREKFKKDNKDDEYPNRHQMVDLCADLDIGEAKSGNTLAPVIRILNDECRDKIFEYVHALYIYAN